ncbi:hypothetical protein JPSP56_08700 [Staphylococcus pseudintermedius]
MGSEVDGANLKCDSFFLNGLRAEGNYINHVTKEMHQTIKHKHILHYKKDASIKDMVSAFLRLKSILEVVSKFFSLTK